MDVEISETREVYRGFFRLFKIFLRYRRFDGRMSRTIALEALERGVDGFITETISMSGGNHGFFSQGSTREH